MMLLASAIGLLPCGCGKPNALGRLSLSGEVLFDGVPLGEGLIEFAPTDPAGVSSGSVIHDGQYRIEAHQGVPPGDYIVRITSPIDVSVDQPEEGEVRPPGPSDNGPRQPPPATERIPAEFNVRSGQVITVAKGGSNRFDFDISSSRK